MSKCRPQLVSRRHVALLSVVLLAACGRKGPLYLPDDESNEKKKPKKTLAGKRYPAV